MGFKLNLASLYTTCSRAALRLGVLAVLLWFIECWRAGKISAKMRQNKTKTEIIKKIDRLLGSGAKTGASGSSLSRADSAGDDGDGDGDVWPTDEEAAESATIWALVARIEAAGVGLGPCG